MANARAPQLQESNSQLYISRPNNVKFCYLNPNPAQYKLSWGVQDFAEPHVVVVAQNPQGQKDDDGMLPMEIYGCDREVFHTTHLPSPEVPNGWYKVVEVRAAQVVEPTEIVTVVDDKVESRSVVPPGHWIVQNPGGEQYYNSPEIFSRNYQLSPKEA